MKKRLLITSIVMMLVVAVALSTATYAWFSTNRTVTATGMKITATTSASLVITNTAANIDSSSNSIAMTAIDKALKPATHLNGQKSDKDTTISYATDDTYLVKVSSEDVIDAHTGLGESYFEKVPVAGNNDAAYYYIDYTVYIASKGDALSGQDLTAKIVPPEISGSRPTIHNAISVDYWVGGVYAATDNFLTADGNSYSGVKIITNGAIPSSSATSGDKYVTVLMRVYFDGALTYTEGTSPNEVTKAYVNNDTIDTTAITFGVSFTATAYVAPSQP